MKMKMPKKSLKKMPMLVAGGVGERLVKNLTKKYLIKDEAKAKFIPAVPLILGLMLAENSKTENIGIGMATVAGVDLIGGFVPTLAGLEDMDLSGIFGDDEMGDPLADDVGGPLEGPLEGVEEFETY